jgi:hypothetical protein
MDDAVKVTYSVKLTAIIDHFASTLGLTREEAILHWVLDGAIRWHTALLRDPHD